MDDNSGVPGVFFYDFSSSRFKFREPIGEGTTHACPETFFVLRACLGLLRANL